MTTEPETDETARRTASDIDKRVGKNIRRLRTGASMSQEKLGERIGCTFQQVQKYEKGTNRISAGRLFQIASIFGTSVETFFHGAPDVPVSAASPLARLGALLDAPDAPALLTAYIAATPHNQRAILSLARTLASTPSTETKAA